MFQIAVFFTDGKSELVECEDFEATNASLRLYGRLLNDEEGRPMIGQFRLTGDGAIVGWALGKVEVVDSKNKAGQAELP